MAYTQMNIRIDGETKAKGDKVFSSIGCTPTEAARILWDFAAAHEHDSQAVIDCLETMRSANLEHEARQERRRLAWQGIASLDQQFLALGDAAAGNTGSSLDDTDAIEEALVARLSERGLW